MATVAPSVPNHLIREIMHAIQLHGNGNAMGSLALSSKEAFSVFKYVIGHDVVGDLVNKNEALNNPNPLLRSTLSKNNGNDSEKAIYNKLPIMFNTKSFYNIAVRYIRKLHVTLNGTINLPKLSLEYDIAELTVEGYVNSDEQSLTPILDSWKNLRVLKIKRVTNKFLDDVCFGVFRLNNLQNLELKVTRRQLENLLTTAPRFPFPEVVTLQYGFGDNVPIDLATSLTFPEVKRLNFQCSSESHLTFEIFKMLRNLVQCFPSLEAAKIAFNGKHAYSIQGITNQLTQCHEWCNNANFTVPVEINYCAVVEFTHAASIQVVNEHLKSLGYTESIQPHSWIIEKEYANVRLIHCLTREHQGNAFVNVDTLDSEEEDDDWDSDDSMDDL
uniref:F-box domain-containing protein n=1 Tax=Panagrellus redivivus TaxID=6233 RepID=A0A7E4VIB6_PANRE